MRITAVLARVPVIKFRKGTSPSHASAAGPVAAPAAVPSASAAAASPPARVQVQSASAMSTAPISDIDLPPRYRRRPLSQEEIDHINGGGIV